MAQLHTEINVEVTIGTDRYAIPMNLLPLPEIGPTSRDRTWRGRVQLHMAWYRSTQLGLEVGSTQFGKPSGVHLTEADGLRLLNLESDDARRAYVTRHGQGWGLSPFQCQRSVGSSQAMMLNLFAPLASDLPWLTNVIRDLLQLDGTAQGVHFEWAPTKRSLYLGDMTRVDALIEWRTSSNQIGLIVCEFKLTDRYTRRVLPISETDAYRNLLRASGRWSHWPTEDRLNQLARSHALAEAASHRHGLFRSGTFPLLVLFHHKADAEASPLTERYGEFLHDSCMTSVRQIAVEQLILASRLLAEQQQHQLMDRLAARYSQLERSDYLVAVT